MDKDFLLNYYEKHMMELVKKAKIAIADAMRDAYAQYFKDVRVVALKIFRESVEAFYNSYSPSYYDRRGSLYGMVELESGEDYFKMDYNDDLPTDRSGGSLYEIVFKEGWHGGAYSGPNHPNPGTPYYRAPRDRYYTWMLNNGRAAKADISPLDDINQRVKVYEQEEMQNVFNNICREKISNIKISW